MASLVTTPCSAFPTGLMELFSFWCDGKLGQRDGVGLGFSNKSLSSHAAALILRPVVDVHDPCIAYFANT